MIVRMYTGPDNQTHIEEMPLPPPEMERTPFQNTDGIQFRRFPAGDFMDWHPAPRRQYVITLEGNVEIGLGDGTVRRFGPGDVVLAEDLTGQGHTTRVVGDGPRVTATIPVVE